MTAEQAIIYIKEQLDASEPQPKGGQHVGPMASHWNMTPSTRKDLRWVIREVELETKL